MEGEAPLTMHFSLSLASESRPHTHLSPLSPVVLTTHPCTPHPTPLTHIHSQLSTVVSQTRSS